MTRGRVYGSDTPFCAWMRTCPDLPSHSKNFGFTSSDNDITVHKYMTSVDSIGTREVQAIMQVEIKTRCGKPEESQMDTLSKLNLFKGYKRVNGTHINFFGVFILVLSGTKPENSKRMWWGKIPEGKVCNNASNLIWVPVDKDKLIKLLRFDLHPVSLTTNAFRRHHKTREILVTETTPLGFECDRILIKRS